MVLVHSHVRVNPQHDLSERDRLGAGQDAGSGQQRGQNHEQNAKRSSARHRTFCFIVSLTLAGWNQNGEWLRRRIAFPLKPSKPKAL